MRKGLLISTMLVSVAGLGMSAEAANQCLQTPSCESLGYTQTSCVDNNGVKCPFGNKYFCVCSAKYAYSCSGTGYAGGSGTACGGKYTECTCASGYIWDKKNCKKDEAEWKKNIGYAEKNCNIGDILFSDGTCASDVVSGKTPIAVVVYIDERGYGQALALDSIGSYQWSTQEIDVDTLENILGEEHASQDFDSCGNSEKIMVFGNKNTYPAVWTAYEYKTEGTSAGDWCLPAAGIFYSYKNNKIAINTGLDRADGTKFLNGYPFTYAWSSSEVDSSYAWYSDLTESYGVDSFNGKKNNREVRPVIEFQRK